MAARLALYGSNAHGDGIALHSSGSVGEFRPSSCGASRRARFACSGAIPKRKYNKECFVCQARFSEILHLCPYIFFRETRRKMCVSVAFWHMGRYNRFIIILRNEPDQRRIQKMGNIVRSAAAGTTGRTTRGMQTPYFSARSGSRRSRRSAGMTSTCPARRTTTSTTG